MASKRRGGGGRVGGTGKQKKKWGGGQNTKRDKISDCGKGSGSKQLERGTTDQQKGGGNRQRIKKKNELQGRKTGVIKLGPIGVVAKEGRGPKLAPRIKNHKGSAKGKEKGQVDARGCGGGKKKGKKIHLGSTCTRNKQRMLQKKKRAHMVWLRKGKTRKRTRPH